LNPRIKNGVTVIKPEHAVTLEQNMSPVIGYQNQVWKYKGIFEERPKFTFFIKLFYFVYDG